MTESEDSEDNFVLSYRQEVLLSPVLILAGFFMSYYAFLPSVRPPSGQLYTAQYFWWQPFLFVGFIFFGVGTIFLIHGLYHLHREHPKSNKEMKHPQR